MGAHRKSPPTTTGPLWGGTSKGSAKRRTSMLARSLLAFTSLVFTEHSTNESSGNLDEKTEQVFPGPSGALGTLQVSMSIREVSFENNLTCMAIGVVLTLRILQMAPLPVSVHSGELRSSAACAVPTRLNSDAAAARLAVRIIISFPRTELVKSRTARGLGALIIYWTM